MPQHPTTWARNARLRLLTTLGGCCAKCFALTHLEFDCILPQGHIHHTLGTVKRMIFYRRQHAERNLQILCNKCNRKKAKLDVVYLKELEEIRPF